MYVCGAQDQAALKKQLEKALAGAEESHLSVKSNKEVAAPSLTRCVAGGRNDQCGVCGQVIAALQSRLMEVEPELTHCRDKVREQERLISAAALMKVRATPFCDLT